MKKSGKVVGITLDDGFVHNLEQACRCCNAAVFRRLLHRERPIGGLNIWDRAKGVAPQSLMDARQSRPGWPRDESGPTRAPMRTCCGPTSSGARGDHRCKRDLERRWARKCATSAIPTDSTGPNTRRWCARRLRDGHTTQAAGSGTRTTCSSCRGCRCCAARRCRCCAQAGDGLRRRAAHMSRPKACARRLRLAVLNRVFSPAGGGAESYSIRIVEQLAARHDVHYSPNASNTTGRA